MTSMSPRRRIPARVVATLFAALAATESGAQRLEPNHVFVPCVQTPEVDRITLDGEVTALPLAPSTFRAVAVGATGTVWLADFNLSLWSIDQAGTTLGKIPLRLPAVSIAVDRDDSIWAAIGSGSGGVMKFSKDGRTEADVRGFTLPSGLAVDGDNRAWVSDVGSDKLVRLSPSGAMELVITVPSCPRDVAIDRSGHVWVAVQCPQPRLVKFDEDGAPLGDFSIPGTILGSIVTDRSGDVWVSTPLTNSIHRFSHDGELRATYSGIASATSISIDGEGKLWITGDNASLVTRFDPDAGAVMATVRTGTAPRGRGDMTGYTRALIADPDGDVDGDHYSNAREIDLGSNPFTARSIPYAWLAGNVNLRTGSAQDVLFVNDSAGLPAREISLTTWEPIVVFVDAPALATGPAAFSLYAMPGLTVEGTLPVEQPYGIGASAFPTPLSGGEPQPLVIVNGFRSRNGPAAGTPRLSGVVAPGIVRTFPAGFGRPFRVVLQGLIADPGSAGPGISITNAIGVTVR